MAPGTEPVHSPHMLNEASTSPVTLMIFVLSLLEFKLLCGTVIYAGACAALILKLAYLLAGSA